VAANYDDLNPIATTTSFEYIAKKVAVKSFQNVPDTEAQTDGAKHLNVLNSGRDSRRTAEPAPEFESSAKRSSRPLEPLFRRIT